MEYVRKVMLKPRWNSEEVECLVEIEFDLEGAMLYLGERALRNKSKKARLGYVKASVRLTQAQQARSKHEQAIET